jgi:hypothetical protein
MTTSAFILLLAAIGLLVATGDSIFKKVATMAEKMVRKHGPSVTTKRETRNIVPVRHGRDSRLHCHVGRSLLRATKKKLHTSLVKSYVGTSTFLFFFRVEGF